MPRESGHIFNSHSPSGLELAPAVNFQAHPGFAQIGHSVRLGKLRNARRNVASRLGRRSSPRVFMSASFRGSPVRQGRGGTALNTPFANFDRANKSLRTGPGKDRIINCGYPHGLIARRASRRGRRRRAGATFCLVRLRSCDDGSAR